MSMDIRPGGSRVVFDKVLDCIPGASLVNNLFDVFEKAVVSRKEPQEIKKDRYWVHLNF